MNQHKNLVINERRKASVLRALTISVAYFGNVFLLKAYGLTLLDALSVTGYTGLIVYALLVGNVITPPAREKSVEEFEARVESTMRELQINLTSKNPARAAEVLANEIGYHCGGFSDDRAKTAMKKALLKHIEHID